MSQATRIRRPDTWFETGWAKYGDRGNQRGGAPMGGPGRSNQSAVGKTPGFCKIPLYRAANASNTFLDIVQGNNGSYKATRKVGIAARVSAANGTALVKALRGAPAAKTS